MTIWLLAILLMASTAALGYRQGAIRVVVSFFGIIVAALLAPALGKFVKPLITAFGVTNPVWPWFLCPIVVFVIISALFKAAALPLHQKVDVHFRYHAGDLRQVLWERLNRRLGLCLGLFNGAAYFILISFLIYSLSYWSFQIANSEDDPKTVRWLNRLGQDLNSSGFDKVARAIDRMPETYFQTADLAGLLYHNSLLEARLARYPAFLSLSERSEFVAIGADKEFIEMRTRQESLSALLKHGTLQAVMSNPELLRLIWTTTLANLQDLTAYLQTGTSSKYGSQKLLGRWRFDVPYAAATLRKLRPTMSANEMQRTRAWMRAVFDQTKLLATTEGTATLRNLPELKPPAPNAPPATGPQTLQGTWKDLDGRYQFNFQGKDDIFGTIESDRLVLTVEGMPLAFLPEDY